VQRWTARGYVAPGGTWPNSPYLGGEDDPRVLSVAAAILKVEEDCKVIDILHMSVSD